MLNTWYIGALGAHHPDTWQLSPPPEGATERAGKTARHPKAADYPPNDLCNLLKPIAPHEQESGAITKAVDAMRSKYLQDCPKEEVEAREAVMKIIEQSAVGVRNGTLVLHNIFYFPPQAKTVTTFPEDFIVLDTLFLENFQKLQSLGRIIVGNELRVECCKNLKNFHGEVLGKLDRRNTPLPFSVHPFLQPKAHDTLGTSQVVWRKGVRADETYFDPRTPSMQKPVFQPRMSVEDFHTQLRSLIRKLPHDLASKRQQLKDVVRFVLEFFGLPSDEGSVNFEEAFLWGYDRQYQSHFALYAEIQTTGIEAWVAAQINLEFLDDIMNQVPRGSLPGATVAIEETILAALVRTIRDFPVGFKTHIFQGN